jgi:hypothetical protein
MEKMRAEALIWPMRALAAADRPSVSDSQWDAILIIRTIIQ